MAGKVDPALFEAAREVARRRAIMEKSPYAFIDMVVKIESPDTEGVIIPFKLWPEQQEALQSIHENRLNIVLKARQLGFTWLGLSYCLWDMLFNPGHTVVGLSKDEDNAKELVRRLGFMLQNLPRWLIRHYEDAEGWEGPIWEPQVLNIKIKFPNGLTSRFLGESSSRDSGRSFTANIVLIDEWAIQSWAHEIWQAAYPTVNRPTGGKVIGISTAKPGTLFHEIWKGAPKNGFKRVFIPWWADPRRDSSWLEETKKAMPRTWAGEFPSTPAEAFSVGVDRFFPDFNLTIHTFDPFRIPESWSRLCSLDWGFISPFAVLWGAVDFDGRIWIYRELYDKQLHVPTVADLILNEEGIAEELIESRVGDYAIWNRSGSTGPTVGEQFLEAGIVWDKSDKDRVNGWQEVHRRMMPFPTDKEGKTPQPMLMISRGCENLIRELQEILQSKTNPEDLDTKMSDHALDSLRYMCMSRPMTPQEEDNRPAYMRRLSKPKGTWMGW